MHHASLVDSCSVSGIEIGHMYFRALNPGERTLGVSCLAIAMVIVVAGLWPFDFRPENKVNWLRDRDGVRFYGRGIIFSDPADKDSQRLLFNGGPITLEIWLQSEIEPNSYLPCILSLYDGNESEEFFLGQWKSSLILRTKVLDRKSKRPFREVGVGNALPKGQSRFIAITSDEKGTCIYVDGRLEKTSPNFSIIPENRSASKQIILGNSPRGKDHWLGNISGLAIYKRLLTAEQVFDHFQNWVSGKRPSPSKEENPVAIYLFDERAGTRIQDQINRYDLLMPPRFKTPQREILVPPWRDLRLNLSYFRDIMTNIFGFIPFGFFFLAYLYERRIRSGLNLSLLSIFAGGLLSLTIELIQVYLPDRNSQLMDVFTNTIGTALGAILFHFYQSSGKS